MSAPATTAASFKLPLGLVVAVLVMVGVLLLPLPADLPVAGHRMLAILAFAVVVWISEAVSYEASAIMITSLMAFLLGTAPSLQDPAHLIGSSPAIGMALTGFSNPALALVAGALFIAAAMTHTGLDRRIALVTLTRVGTSTRGILLGAIAVTILLSLVVPSATARSACVVPIMMGVVAAFGVDKRSNIAAGLMIVVAQGTSIWNVGIQTAAAQNLLTVGFMDKMLGQRVSWIDWLIAGAPWALIMSAVLLFLVLKLLPPETDSIPGGKEAVAQSLVDIGPMTGPQKRLLAVSVLLLLAWATEGRLHNFDTTSTTYAGLVFLLLPGYAVYQSVGRTGLGYAGVWVAVMSISTYVMYASDKHQARVKGWRDSESSMHFMELLGGWPGAFFAQRMLRHKSTKGTYQFTYGLIVGLYQIVAVDALRGWPVAHLIGRIFQKL